MRFYEYCEMADVHPGYDVITACAYLEAFHKMKFAVDFDLENAVVKAEALHAIETQQERNRT